MSGDVVVVLAALGMYLRCSKHHCDPNKLVCLVEEFYPERTIADCICFAKTSNSSSRSFVPFSGS